MKNIKSAIFDMDGTLVDSLMLWDIIWKKFGVKFLNDDSFRPRTEDDKAVRTLTLKDAMAHIHKVYNIGKSGEELLCEANAIMRNFYANEVMLKDGVADFLEYCREKGIKMCIASATDMELLDIALEHCNIKKYFSEIFSCAVIGKGKEEPDIYIAAMKHLGTSLEETCVFEDSCIAINTAHKIGMKTVAIYDKFNYGQEEMKNTADVYIAKGETMHKLMGVVC